MALPQSKVTAQGQISVPAAIRRKLGIGTGTVLEWETEGDHVLVRKAGTFTSEEIHHAVFPAGTRPRRLDELKDGVRKHLSQKHARR